MIYITGDTHADITRFEQKCIKKLKHTDTLIICGDFGFIWDGSAQEQKVLTHLGKSKFKILFIDGKHENFDLLQQYPIVDAFGSKARHITGNLYHLLRGNVYDIEDKKIFTFGGGESPDKEIRIETGTWWKQEMPEISEMNRSVDILNSYDRKVDYIITHEPPAYIKKMINRNYLSLNPLDVFFDSITKEVSYKKWFFGYTHMDKKISTKHFSVFRDVLTVEPKIRKRFMSKSPKNI